MKTSSFNRVCSLVLVGLFVVAISAVALLATEAANLQEAEHQPDGNGYRPEVPMRAYPAYERSPVLGAGPLEGVTLMPESLDVWLSPGESVVEDKILHLPEHPLPTKADILICFDLTGSMGGELANVKANAIDIMEGVRDLVPDTYFGVISHTDYPGTYAGCGYAGQYGDPVDGDFPYSLDRSLTSDLVSVHGAINSLSLGDGSDAPECYSRALYATYTDGRIGWRRGARHIVLQWGDNIPHDCNFGDCIGLNGTSGPDPGPDAVAGNGDDLEILSVIDAMDDNEITLVSMYSGLAESRLKLWNCLAGRTGGEAFEINPDGTVAGDENITDYIVGAIGEQFEVIDHLTLEVCDEGYENWLVDVDPPAYTDVVLDAPQDLEFSITLQVPEGTPPGDYCFEICAVGDGAVYAQQYVCIHVRPDECFDLDIGDVTGNAGEIVRVPVTIQDATGWGIHLIDLDICWCPEQEGALALAGFAAGPVLVENKLEVNASQTGRSCLTFVGKSEEPLIGGGVLFYIDFEINEEADPCDCCDVVFVSVIFDNSEFIEICPEDGSVCLENCRIDGFVHNWYCEETRGGPVLTDPLSDVEMLIFKRCYSPDLYTGEPLATTQTDPSGYYVFECLAPLDNVDEALDDFYCEYCVEPGTIEDPPGWITAYDASLILRYHSEQIDLDKCPFDGGDGTVYPQRVAGDTDCGFGLTEVDADLVLQYVVGLISTFPGCPDWVWVPERRCTGACPDELDFIGVLKGDVSGPMPDPVLDAAHIKVGIPRHYWHGDVGFVEVPIRVKDATDVFSVEFSVEYNDKKLILESVEPTGLASGFAVAHNDLIGTDKVALAGSGSFNGSGKIANLTFRKKGLTVPWVQTLVSITDALFNEGDPPAVIDGHDYPAEIVRFVLGPVSPNPFSEGTVISFAAPQAASVSLTIFNVRGQVVSEVFRGDVGAGVHQITWDGRDNAGSRVARGVYFCRMEAAGFSATEKLVLLR